MGTKKAVNWVHRFSEIDYSTTKLTVYAISTYLHNRI